MVSGEGIVEEGIGRGGGADEPPGVRRSNGARLEVVVAVGKSMRGEEWGRGARLGDEAGGGGEAERTSGSSPVGIYFAFWKTRLFTIESGLPGKGQTSASASAPAQAWAWASAVTATEAGAGARDESGGEGDRRCGGGRARRAILHVDPRVRVARVRDALGSLG